MGRTRYCLKGEDRFANEYYDIPGAYDTRAEAEAALQERQAHIERTQPTISSGGQGFGGIQDSTWIESFWDKDAPALPPTSGT